jgi:glucan phosphoethanolaminetransferase (alkaline phosphatase superfamily)
MIGYLMILTALLLSLFLVLGVVSHIQKTGRKWIYFILAALSLFSLVLMLFFFNWDLSKPGNHNPEPPKTENPAKGNENHRNQNQVKNQPARIQKVKIQRLKSQMKSSLQKLLSLKMELLITKLKLVIRFGRLQNGLI